MQRENLLPEPDPLPPPPPPPPRTPLLGEYKPVRKSEETRLQGINCLAPGNTLRHQVSNNSLMAISSVSTAAVSSAGRVSETTPKGEHKFGGLLPPLALAPNL